jgi:anti-anti-sigma factor
MEYTIRRRGDCLIFKIIGSLDAAAAAELEERFLALIRDHFRQVVIDCAQLSGLSSAGLRSLLKVTRELTAVGGRLTLYSLSEPLQRQLKLTGYATMFRIYRDQDEAITALNITGLLPKIGTFR